MKDSTNQTQKVFPQTRWSLVVAAAADAGPSLEVLCQRYWHPVYAVVRSSGHDVETAKDLTQGFFAKLLEKGWLDAADQDKGRFRSFLVTALKRYLVNEWHREHAAKRGGHQQVVSLDTDFAESLGLSQASRELTPDALFDKKWALTLLEQALVRLRAEEANQHFDLLKDCLTAGRGDIDYAQLAQTMQISEGAVRVAVHRLRKRYRAVIRDEVAQTLVDENEVEDELRILLAALG